MTVKERLIEYLKSKKISKSDFGKAIGVSNAYVTSIRKSIDKDKLRSIASKYPDLNINWLLYGEGEMLRNSDTFHNNQAIVGDNNVQTGNNSNVDNRQYYSDSPDVLRAQIAEKDLLLKEKDERLREKDERLREKDERLREKDEYIAELKELIQELKNK
jgi:transcriptional regulator with XRE-family HTH domain